MPQILQDLATTRHVRGCGWRRRRFGWECSGIGWGRRGEARAEGRQDAGAMTNVIKASVQGEEVHIGILGICSVLNPNIVFTLRFTCQENCHHWCGTVNIDMAILAWQPIFLA